MTEDEMVMKTECERLNKRFMTFHGKQMGKTMETVPDFILFDSKITACGDCRNKIKRLLLLQDSCDKPRQHIKKQRHYSVRKGLSSQSYGFSVVMYGSENWTIKKAEHQIIDAFKLGHWRRCLSPCTARRSNQSILKKTSPFGRTDVEAETPIL